MLTKKESYSEYRDSVLSVRYPDLLSSPLWFPGYQGDKVRWNLDSRGHAQLDHRDARPLWNGGLDRIANECDFINVTIFHLPSICPL